ncbi:hypothetical protein EDC96DRAFT_424228, partial [Choanephora cucurbitarum]
DQAKCNVPDCDNLVLLYPHEVMSYLFWTTQNNIDNRDKNEVVPSIFPNDIDAMATVILQEDIQKHDTTSYGMADDLLASKQKTSILSYSLTSTFLTFK